MKEDEGSILHIYMDESERSKALANKFGLPQTHLGGRGVGWGSGESCNARKIIEFSPSSNFGNSISSTQADKKLLFKY